MNPCLNMLSELVGTEGSFCFSDTCLLALESKFHLARPLIKLVKRHSSGKINVTNY